MAGSTSQIAYSGLERRLNGRARDAVLEVVVIVSVVFRVLEFGVTEAGLNVPPARAGSPLHEKLIAVVKEPCGVTVRANSPDDPAATVKLVLMAASAKSAC
jgi:hypothetical protein